jgi:hypothetical protein
MKKINPAAFLGLCMGAISVTLGMWAFKKISDFFLRLHVLGGHENKYHHMLYDYLSIMIHGGWATRHFFSEFVAPSLIAFGFAALALASLKGSRGAASRHSIAWAAIRFSWLGTLLNGINLIALISIYVYSVCLFARIF